MHRPVCQSHSLRVIESRDTTDAVRRNDGCHYSATADRLQAGVPEQGQP